MGVGGTVVAGVVAGGLVGAGFVGAGLVAPGVVGPGGVPDGAAVVSVPPTAGGLAVPPRAPPAPPAPPAAPPLIGGNRGPPGRVVVRRVVVDEPDLESDEHAATTSPAAKLPAKTQAGHRRRMPDSLTSLA